MFALFLVLGIIMFLIVLPFVTKDKRVFILWISGLAIWIIGLTLFRTFACGHNKHDVNIMKPQANAIIDYIVKNGIPKSMGDISTIPYELMQCKKEIQYKARHYEPLKSKEGAEYAEIDEQCIFFNRKNSYIVRLRFHQYYNSISSVDGYINIENINSKTSINYDIDSDEFGIIKRNKEPDIRSGNHSGICASFGRQ